ncbi:hypothetical protein EDB84DRAFT_1447071 [Lactarius hengduanensis]|nr:hypothetical protein EDB84DRAFT_1447071 [Lactarius hengduanensis]
MGCRWEFAVVVWLATRLFRRHRPGVVVVVMVVDGKQLTWCKQLTSKEPQMTPSFPRPVIASFAYADQPAGWAKPRVLATIPPPATARWRRQQRWSDACRPRQRGDARPRGNASNSKTAAATMPWTDATTTTTERRPSTTTTRRHSNRATTTDDDNNTGNVATSSLV